MRPPQQGFILIAILWFVAMAAVLVAVLASETRLSAKTVFHNQDNLQQWSDTLKALNMAQMELMLARMPLSPDDPENKLSPAERKNPAYKFNGQVLNLAYTQPDSVNVRIYDEVGKINVQRLTTQQMRQILKKIIGDKPEELSKLDDAWQDWVDADDMKRLGGAEKDYYEDLEPPYVPRNGVIETVEELLLIKGFKDVFKNVSMYSAFTVYGSSTGVNPNLATREALLLLPGLDAEAVDKIIQLRKTKEIKTQQDFNNVLKPNQIAEFIPWINFASSNYYTIVIEPKSRAVSQKPLETKTTYDEETEETTEEVGLRNQQAYEVIVQAQGTSQQPKVLMVLPYGMVPDMQHELAKNKDESS
ncbi:type II secretory pathway, component PulK [Beggiatoa alba B18LD]|uniref:Type II secretory pathway, component PulK n=1 Tax=Beggiatoa alba B18LD TaxID=395493 RepID=I3CFQ6_9GAMM|nr:type II secretion system protein GspK [Beggiatoa alba]EIJ42449.1 type II secretory pathway, component PulK [Beggiatoa alba B18LD]